MKLVKSFSAGLLNATGFRGKTLWDWLGLLFVPLVLAVGVIWFQANSANSLRESSERLAETQRLIEYERAQENAFQSYIDRMTELVLEQGLMSSQEGDELRAIARGRTLTALRQMDGTRKGQVLQFLYSVGLVNSDPIVSLEGADFTCASLQDVDLSGSNLSGVNFRYADLSGSDLEMVDMSEAALRGVNLRFADLRGADLRGAFLFTADVSLANLAGANLLNNRGFWEEARYLGSIGEIYEIGAAPEDWDNLVIPGSVRPALADAENFVGATWYDGTFVTEEKYNVFRETHPLVLELDFNYSKPHESCNSR